MTQEKLSNNSGPSERWFYPASEFGKATPLSKWVALLSIGTSTGLEYKPMNVNSTSYNNGSFKPNCAKTPGMTNQDLLPGQLNCGLNWPGIKRGEDLLRISRSSDYSLSGVNVYPPSNLLDEFTALDGLAFFDPQPFFNASQHPRAWQSLKSLPSAAGSNRITLQRELWIIPSNAALDQSRSMTSCTNRELKKASNVHVLRAFIPGFRLFLLRTRNTVSGIIISLPVIDCAAYYVRQNQKKKSMLDSIHH